jgi:hypothetical protein
LAHPIFHRHRLPLWLVEHAATRGRCGKQTKQRQGDEKQSSAEHGSTWSYFFDFELLNHCVGCIIRLHTEGAGFFFLLAVSTIGAANSEGPAVLPRLARLAPLKSTNVDDSSWDGADWENMPAPNSGAPLKTTTKPTTRKRRKIDIVKVLRDKLKPSMCVKSAKNETTGCDSLSATIGGQNAAWFR